MKEVNYDVLILELVRTLYKCQALIGTSSKVLNIFPILKTAELDSLTVEQIAKCNDLLHMVGDKLQLKVPQFVWPIPKQASSLEIALSRFCQLTLKDWKNLSDCLFLDVIVKAVSVNKTFKHERLQSEDLPEFKVYSQGNSNNEAVILVLPCAVPAQLFQPWLDLFAENYFVITLEDPYLFDSWHTLAEPSGEISIQVKFIAELLKRYSISQAHLVGICGGVPAAIAAAAHLGKQIASLALCHGDLNFGINTPRTPFQEQFQGLLLESTNNKARAKEVLSLFHDPALLVNIPDQLGPFILYPYCDFNLFQRYAKVNSSLMLYNATQAANKLTQPTLIITSKDDRMTHPGASYMLHKLIHNSEFLERKTGNHQDALLGNEEMFTAILQFIERVTSETKVERVN